MPADGRLDDPSSWLSAQTLSELFNLCRADVKMLAIDATPLTVATASRGGSHSRSIPGDRLLGLFSAPESRSFLLSSCRAGESSNFWNERGEGVFSYWLTRALDGAADIDGDGLLTFDELAEYTQDRTSRTVERLKLPPQTPARTETMPEVARRPVAALKTETLIGVCKRIAAHLDEDVRLRGLNVIAVRDEFLIKGADRQDHLAAFALPQFLAGIIRQELTALAKVEPRYLVVVSNSIVDPPAPRTCDGPADPPAAAIPPIPDATIRGALSLNDRGVEVQSELIDAAGQTLTKPGGVIPLNENNLGNLGQTFDLTTASEQTPDRGQLALQQSSAAHPLLDPEVPVPAGSLPCCSRWQPASQGRRQTQGDVPAPAQRLGLALGDRSLAHPAVHHGGP